MTSAKRIGSGGGCVALLRARRHGARSRSSSSSSGSSSSSSSSPWSPRSASAHCGDGFGRRGFAAFVGCGGDSNGLTRSPASQVPRPARPAQLVSASSAAALFHDRWLLARTPSLGGLARAAGALRGSRQRPQPCLRQAAAPCFLLRIQASTGTMAASSMIRWGSWWLFRGRRSQSAGRDRLSGTGGVRSESGPASARLRRTTGRRCDFGDWRRLRPPRQRPSGWHRPGFIGADVHVADCGGMHRRRQSPTGSMRQIRLVARRRARAHRPARPAAPATRSTAAGRARPEPGSSRNWRVVA